MSPEPPDDAYFVRAPAPTASARAHDRVPPPSATGRRPLADGRSLLLLAVVGALVVAAAAVAGRASAPPALHVPGPVTVTDGDRTGTYRFQYVDAGGEPVRWDPCAPIRYVVNLTGAPYGTSRQDVAEAFARAGEVTGLRFVDAGTTEEPPREDRPSRQPERYGAGWAPVLVAWADPASVPALHGSVVGVASVVPAGVPPTSVSGAIYLDRGADLRPGFGRGRAWGTVLLHEVGHLVGLDHVDDEGEIMYRGGERGAPGAAVRFGPGDTAGLRRLGLEAGCRTAPDAPPALGAA